MDIRDQYRKLSLFRPRSARAEIEGQARVGRAFTRLEDLVPGEILENEAGACYVAQRTYALNSAHGPLPLGALLAQNPSALSTYTPSAHLDALLEFGQAAFLDTETTGLGPGASVYAFMVGVGSFEASPSAAGAPVLHYVVRQFFMRSPAEEPALLVALAQHLRDKNLIVSFNGRSFDLPLLRTRFLFNRRTLPASARNPELLAQGAPHLDLLHPARQLWKRRLQSCSLHSLEVNVLGLSRTVDDVPGADIPQMYIDYVRTGSAEQVQRVFYHNREDIVSTTALTTQVCRVLDAALGPDVAAPGEDWLAAGAAHERAGHLALAEDAYHKALPLAPDSVRAELFLRLGRVQKRRGHWREAVATWELWVTSVPGVDPTPYIELAKCYEWDARDLEQAEMWAAWGLHTLQNAPQWQRRPGQMQGLEQRLARLRAKRAR